MVFQIGSNPMNYSPLGYAPANLSMAPVYSCKPEFNNNQHIMMFGANDETDNEDKVRTGWEMVDDFRNTITGSDQFKEINKIWQNKSYKPSLRTYLSNGDSYRILREDLDKLLHQNDIIEEKGVGNTKEILHGIRLRFADLIRDVNMDATTMEPKLIAIIESGKPPEYFENNQSNNGNNGNVPIKEKKENCWNLVNTIIDMITSSKHYSVILSDYESGNNDKMVGPFRTMTEDIEFLSDEINSPCETTRFGDVKDTLREIIKNWIRSLEAYEIPMDETNAIATDLRDILDRADEDFVIGKSKNDKTFGDGNGNGDGNRDPAINEWLEDKYDVTMEQFKEDVNAITDMIDGKDSLLDVTGMNDDETLKSKFAKYNDTIKEYETIFTGYGNIDDIASLAPLFGAFAGKIDHIEQRTLDDKYSSINPEIVDDFRTDFNEIMGKYITDKRECENVDFSWSMLKSECKCKSKVALYKKPVGRIKIGIGAIAGILVLLFGGIGIAKLINKRKQKQVV